MTQFTTIDGDKTIIIKHHILKLEDVVFDNSSFYQNEWHNLPQ